MQSNEQSESAVWLEWYCYDEIKESFQYFKKVFESLKKNQKYYIEVRGFNTTIPKCFFEKAFKKQNPNMISFQFEQAHLKIQEWKLFTSKTWNYLYTLIFNKTDLDNHCSKALSKCQLPNLNTLKFYDCSISDIGVSHICKGKWERLKQLSLCSSNFSEKNLCKMKYPLLQELFIQSSKISGKYLFNTKKNVGWENLKKIKIGQRRVRQTISFELSNICQYPFHNIQTFSLSWSFLSKNSMKFFTRADWSYLNYLELYSCSFEDESVRVLNKCEWKRLNNLQLSSNEISDCSIDYLSYGNWPQLQVFTFGNNRITNFGKLISSKLTNVEIPKFIQMPKIIRQVQIKK